MTTYVNVADNADCRCEHCGGLYEGRDMDPINEPETRVIAGKPVPAGQCPNCGALAYVITETGQKLHSILMALRLLIGGDRINATDIYAARDLLDEAIVLARKE